MYDFLLQATGQILICIIILFTLHHDSWHVVYTLTRDPSNYMSDWKFTLQRELHFLDSRENLCQDSSWEHRERGRFFSRKERNLQLAWFETCFRFKKNTFKCANQILHISLHVIFFSSFIFHKIKKIHTTAIWKSFTRIFILWILFFRVCEIVKFKAYYENCGKCGKNIDHRIKILFDFKADTDSYSCKKLFVFDQSPHDRSLYLKAANTKGRGSHTGLRYPSICTEH